MSSTLSCGNSLSQDEHESPELEQIPHDEEERVKHLFALGRASAEEDDDEGDGAEGRDGEVEGVPVSAERGVWASISKRS